MFQKKLLLFIIFIISIVILLVLLLFLLSPLTYQEITRTFRKMKTSGSQCPLDQISMIPFAHCPYLRSYVT